MVPGVGGWDPLEGNPLDPGIQRVYCFSDEYFMSQSSGKNCSFDT